ncbi:MAG: hypothetical protein LJE84_07365 [Gammaproteobacteria bacterium]|nr:hypothetical protein [Gammaproteobacteria bacterium]
MSGRGNRELWILTASGLASGSVCWLGGFLPLGDRLQDLYPGIVLGLALVLSGRRRGADRAPAAWSWLWLPVFATAGWRFAVEVAYAHGDPLPFAAAGAAGALITALGLAMRWNTTAGALRLVVALTVAGALAGQLFALVEAPLNTWNDQAWALVLFTEWQAIFFLTIGLAERRR